MEQLKPLVDAYGSDSAILFALIAGPIDHPSNLWKRETEIKMISKGVMNARRAKRTLMRNVERNLIKRKPLDPHSIKDLLMKKEPQAIVELHLAETCQWCNAHTYTLERHHWPIPRQDGGTGIVTICGSCHAEYHALEKDASFRLSDNLIEVFNELKGL